MFYHHNSVVNNRYEREDNKHLGTAHSSVSLSLSMADHDNCTRPVHYPNLPDPACVVDTNTDEVIVAAIIVIIVLITFYRILHVWAYTLNFSEASIQGPQGWDLVVNWIMERIKRTRTTRWRRRSKSHAKVKEEPVALSLTEDDVSRSLPIPPIVVLETPSGPTSPIRDGRTGLSRASSLRSSNTTLRDPWIMSLHYVRNARSMREIYQFKQTLSASSNYLQTGGRSSSSLVRSHSCRSPSRQRLDYSQATRRAATISYKATSLT